MNIRFDNDQNIVNDNIVKNSTNHVAKAHDNQISKTPGAVAFSKSDNTSSINAYGDKKAIENLMNNVSMDQASVQKDYMVLMSNTVSDEDYKKLAENGYEIGSMTPEETVTIVDEIKATMAKSGNVVAGYNDDLDSGKLEAITGSKVYANQLERAFAEYDVPATNVNVQEAMQAFAMASEITGLNDASIKYLTENNMEPTIENIYMANHSGAINGQSANGYFMDSNGYLGKKSEISNDESIRKQVSDIIEKAGFEPDEAKVNDAFKMIDEGMTLTEETFEKYEQLKDIKFPLDKDDIANKIAMNIKDGNKAKNTDVTESRSLYERANEIVENVNSISDEAIEKVCNSGKAVNLKNLCYAQKTIVINASIQTVSMSSTARGYSMTLSEIRLSMTVSSTALLLKNGMDVENMDLNSLVDELKEAGNRQFEALFGQEFSVDKAGLKELFEDTTEKLNEIKGMPVGAVGLMASRNAFSLNVLYEEGKTLQSRYISAGEKYEPLMTEVRSDLGDNIRKAFSNVEDILKEMNLDVTEENQRAVRILGYNSQDINFDSIDKIKEVYERVHNVIAKMTPAKTLDLIRNGINPLQTNLDELEKELDLNPLKPVEEAERYSHFLYRMEQSHRITEDEKESFIGIYRMINAIEKDDGAAIGTLVASNGEINFKNLVTAVRTRHNKGIDAKVDDQFGALSKISFKDATITEQIAKAFESKTEKYEPDSYIIDDIEENYIHEMVEEYRDVREVKDSVINLLLENNILPTNDNLQATKDISLNRGKIYRNVAKLSEKSTFNSKNVDNNVDKSDIGAANVDKSVDFTEDALDKLADSLTDRESMNAAFGEMLTNIDSFLNEEALKAGNHIDVKDIAASMKRMNVVRELGNNECYEVPAYIDGELTSIRVSVLHKDNMIPNVNLTLETESYGKVNASFGFENGVINGYVVCDNDDAISKLKRGEEQFTSASGELNIKNISYFKSSNTDINYFAGKTDKLNSTEKDSSNGIEENEGKDAISTKALYKIAKEFIKTYAK